ncbi:ABC transporter substrate-binding protein [Tropicimonas sp. IMCC34011]|uniref:ABC transporter substrate-binding protein n=1 Tax=Tropicimonas sp. IMCC34011 TaxID=2248759 RepID=UPI001E3E9A8F|nr:ABC transporter substrate-binding protein [Tropicimonas sp. IMCC34011]
MSLLLGCTATMAVAQEKTLYFASYGGSNEELYKTVLIPKWQETEAGKDVNVEFVAGNSTDTLAKLRAQEGNQQIDVAMMDDGPMVQAISFGYCDTVREDTFEGLYDVARFPESKAVGVQLIATGLTYNTELFEEKGWDAPTSWNDLKDPKYKGMVSVPPITNGYGLLTLIVMAQLDGGGVDEIEPGFKAFEDEIDPNVLTYEPSSGKMSELFQNGDIALSVWGSGRAKSLADTGFPAAFVYPEEGAVALMTAVCPVVGSDVPDAAQDFIQFVTSQETQQYLADTKGSGPVNGSVTLTDEQAASMPVGERAEKMIAVDYTVVNDKRGEWTEQWTRRLER